MEVREQKFVTMYAKGLCYFIRHVEGDPKFFLGKNPHIRTEGFDMELEALDLLIDLLQVFKKYHDPSHS